MTPSYMGAMGAFPNTPAVHPRHRIATDDLDSGEFQTAVDEEIINALADDEFEDAHSTLKAYLAGDDAIRDAIDGAFITLTGWSLTTMIAQAKGQEQDA